MMPSKAAKNVSMWSLLDSDSISIRMWAMLEVRSGKLKSSRFDDLKSWGELISKYALNSHLEALQPLNFT